MRKAHNRIELDEDYIIKEYKNGRTGADIAREIGVGNTVVINRLKELGVTIRVRNTYDELTLELLAKLYTEQKLSARTIAEIVGCSKNLVSSRLGKYGIPARLNAGDPSFTAEERKEMYGSPLETHPLWKGGKTRLTTLVRNRLAYVSTEVLRESRFICNDCGNPDGTKHVHHIKPFAVIIDEITGENPQLDMQDEVQRLQLVDICEADERLLDKANLVTLCEPCHINTHSANPVTVRNHEAVVAEIKAYIDANHFTKSVKQMAQELNMRHTRINKYMESAELPYAYDNKEWLTERLAETHCTEISREFNSMTLPCTPADIRRKAVDFGILERMYGENEAIA